MIRIEDISVQFGAVRPIDQLTVRFKASICGLIGPNGAGKTTLLNVLSGFVTPISGRITLDEIELLEHPTIERIRHGLRRSFQTEQVVEDLSVYDNVLALLDNIGIHGYQAEEQVSRALHYTGLVERADILGEHLNLYERRMVEIARALVGNPRLVLFDEPGAGMSESESLKLREILLGIPDHFGAQVLLIDHDVDLISATCEETLVLDFGHRLAMGPTAEVLVDEQVRKAYLGEEL